MFKNIIFDWSGVIKDSVNGQFWLVNKILQKFEVGKLSYEEFKDNWEQPYMRFYNKYIPNISHDEQHKVYMELTNDKSYPAALDYPGIISLILELKRKKKFLAVLSSDSPNTILPEIKKFGLENIFDDMIIHIHDKTEGMKKIIQNNNLISNETVIIGDSNHEIEIAKAVGAKSIAVTWGFCSEKRLVATGPDYLVHNIKELEEVLLK
jgi:phosphoglycolate phosphatase